MPRTRRLLATAAAFLVGVVPLAVALPASAAPVYEISADWAEGTPSQVPSGDPVIAEIRVNVNDDAQAPSNDPVDDVTFSFAIDNGRFEEIPDNCATSGVSTPSSISADGKTLTCNLGTQDQGTAHVVTPTVIVDGPTGEQVSGVAEIDGQTDSVDPIDILNEFQMDMVWGTPTAGSGMVSPGSHVMWFEWTLNLRDLAEPGPEDITFTMNVAAANGSVTAPNPGEACRPFTEGTTGGHPWSGGNHPPEQMAPFVETCSLEKVNATTYRLHLTGIDYSLTQVPTLDSAGDVRPPAWNAVASGRVYFRVNTTEDTAVTLDMAPHEYTAPGSGATWTDDSSNNQSNKLVRTGVGGSSSWHRSFTGSGGDSWDDTYRVSRGTAVRQSITWETTNMPGSGGDQYGLCMPLDTKYLTFVDAGTESAARFPLEYYVGTNSYLNPGHSNYDPNHFSCGWDPGGWTTTAPSDLSTVRAVRSMYTLADARTSTATREVITVEAEIKEDTPIGQDVWSFGQRYWADSGWEEFGSSGGRIDTPGARYQHTHTFRDILRIIDATPEVEKTVDRSVVTPGVPVNFTVTYSAEGAGAIPPTVDGFEIVDTLPEGMTYVPGSVTPEPNVSTDGQGRQVLSWTLDGVETNVKHPLTYQAVASDDVAAGTVLTNTAQVNYGSGGPKSDAVSLALSSDGFTSIGKTADAPYIPNIDGDGVGEGSWTVSLRSYDPHVQDFTDTIDILPYNGDNRGTDFSGGYELSGVNAESGATVYYTNADPTTLSDDPYHASNGTPGDISGNTVGWSTTKPADATAVRVIGPELPAYATQQFTVEIASDGMEGGDDLVNRAQGVAGHTELVMRTSAPITMANYYSAALKKYVQDTGGEWRDANTVEDYPSFGVGSEVNYRIVVENTGQGTLTGIEVSDDKQPELGSFTINELEPGQEQVHEYSITVTEDMGDGVVNTACAAVDIPEDSQVPPTINCDPAGFEIGGDPTHTKTIASVGPIGDGQWEVVYNIEVENTENGQAEYSLVDELRFTDQVDIVSAQVTDSPDSVTLADPAWDGQNNLDVVQGATLLGNEHADYASHVYELTVVADVPMAFQPPSEGDLEVTQCDAEGADTATAFNNTSTLTKPDSTTEDDQACAPIPSISMDKSVSEAAAENPDGTWTLSYEINVTNDGHADGEYDLIDRLRFGEGVEVDSAVVTQAPTGVTTSSAWTGEGAEGDPQNVVASGITLEAGSTHTYVVEVTSGFNHETVSPESLECPAPGSGDRGGFANTAAVSHNGHEAEDEVCDSPPTPNIPELTLPVLGGTGVTPYLVGGALVMLLAAITITRKARNR